MANVGSIDRVVRILAGVFLLALPFLPMSAGYFSAGILLNLVVAGVGLVLIATAVMRFCPAYRILGINTCGLR